MSIPRAAWNRASDDAPVPFGRAGSAPVVTADPDDDRRVVVRSSAKTTAAIVAGIIGDPAVLAAAAVRAVSPDGHGGHVGRVYDGDVLAVIADDDDDVTTAAGRMAARKRRGMARPSVGR